MALHHVGLEHRDADVPAAIAFWALLGFAHVPAPASIGGRAEFVEREGTQIHLMRVAEPVVPGTGHTAVVAPDYEDALARLRAAGFDPRPREQHWGSPRAMVTAPGGHRVELMAFPPA